MNVNQSIDQNQAAAIDPYAPTTVAKISGKSLITETAAGCAWLHKYLHPPADRLDSYCGMPDENNQPSVSVEYRFNRDIIPPAGPGQQPVQADTLLFLQTGVAGMPAIAWPIANGNLIYPADFVIAVPHEAFQTTIYAEATQTMRYNYQSVTYSLDSTDFNNQGIVTVAQFRPNIVYEESNTAQGTITTRPVLEVSELPTTGERVSMISPKTYSGLAREGAFVVQRMSQPVNPYKPHITDGFDDPDTPLLWLRTGNNTPYSFKDLAGNPIAIEMLSAPDFTWAWVLFEGLSTTSSVGLPRINVKAISGFEFGVSNGGIYGPFVKTPANYDKLALEAATRASHSMQDGMPASMNSLGSFVIPALKYAPSVISALQPMLQSLAKGITGYFNGKPKSTRGPVRTKPQPKTPPVKAAPSPTPRRKSRKSNVDSLVNQVANKLANMNVTRRRGKSSVTVNTKKRPLLMV